MTETDTELDEWGEGPTDELTLLSNGRVRLGACGTRYLLNGPNMGQMREIREGVIEVLDLSRGAIDVADTAAAKEGDLDAIDRLLTVVRGSATEEQVTNAICGLWRTVVAQLDRGGQKLPDDNDLLPSWLPSLPLIIRLVQHWRTNPLVPGR